MKVSPSNRPTSAILGTARSAGFTLVEIMVVIVILSLLATVVGTSVLGRSEKAAISTAELQVKNLMDVVQNYMIENNRRIPNWEDLLTPDDHGHKWIEREDPPMDPWQNEYIIESDPDFENKPFVYSCGPDGMENTEDDITNKTITQNKQNR